MPLSSVKLKEDDRVNVEPTTVAGISAFLGKLWKMVEDPKTDELISWGKTGSTFVIKNQIDFAKTILPNYYKHNNIASFIRQLNMYGFHKIISTTSGALDSNDNDEIEFTHPCFVRGHPYLLEQIKRKMNNPKENLAKSESGNQFNESIKRVFNDIKNLKGKQEYLGSQLSSVKQENEILWRELSLLRQKHAAQQNVLNKLIRFLVSLAQPSNHGIVKRRLVPLMLKDSSSSSSSSTSRTKQEPIIQDGDHLYTIKKRREASSPGPTIHEIHPSEMLDNVQIIETPVMDMVADSPVIIGNEIINSPASTSSHSDLSALSPNPVPAALYPSSSRKGNTRQFLVSQPVMISGRHSPEYVIPDSTDNPLMELVQETVADDDDNENDYITVVDTDGTEMVAQDSPEPVIIDKGRKRNSRKNVKKNPPPQLNVVKTIAPKPKIETKKKSAPVVDEKKNEPDDFLVDLASLSEPMVEVQTPSTSGIASQPMTTPTSTDQVLKTITNPEEFIPNNKININVDEIINIPPSTTNLSDLGLTIDGVTSLQNTLISPSGNNADGSDDIVFELHEDNIKPFAQKSEVGANTSNKSDNEALMNRISECIDNAQNMKIACTDNSVLTNKTLADLSMHLDSTQNDLDQLKKQIQTGQYVLDMNTILEIFNEDPMDYNMPPENSNTFPKTSDEVLGNELISASTMFDFNDIFNQNDWSQPATPLSTIDADYCELNTPQIESSPTEESQILQPPPSKKLKSK
ncbi:heat shock factor protein 1 isoform X1 [Planococcus citri]|uniref:heat shock factor protein 1 isoform X1 n=2 Tax=Planococcus citri TaxID=170843 RepID=UPI0031F8DC1D